MVNGLVMVLNKFKQEKAEDNPEREEIIKTVDNLKNELEQVHCRLNYTTEPLLIDSIIYEMKAIQKRYEYYIRLCKEKGFVAKGFKRNGIKGEL